MSLADAEYTVDLHYVTCCPLSLDGDMFGRTGFRSCELLPYEFTIFVLTYERMELTRQAGNEPPLVGLMRVFKDYYPDVLVGEVTFGRASVFTVGAAMTTRGSTDKFSTQTKSGGSDLVKSKHYIFRQHRTACCLDGELSG